LGVLDRMEGVQGKALHRTMVPIVPSLLRYGVKPLFGIDRMKALPALLCSDEALMPWVGFNAQQVRQGVCQRGAATRQRPRTEGPMGPETLAHPIVPLHPPDPEARANRPDT